MADDRYPIGPDPLGNNWPIGTPVFNPLPQTARLGFDWGNIANQAFGLVNNFFSSRYAAQAAPYTGRYTPTPDYTPALGPPITQRINTTPDPNDPAAKRAASGFFGALTTTLEAIGEPFGVGAAGAGVGIAVGLWLLTRDKPRWSRRG